MAFQLWKQRPLTIILEAKIRDQIEKGRQNYFKPESEVSKTNFGAGNKRLNLKFQSDIWMSLSQYVPS